MACSTKRLAASSVLVLLLSVSVATAQTPDWQHQLYVNAGPQFVTGDQSEMYSTGFALDAGYYYRAADALFLGVTGGYHQFSGDGGGDLSVVPLNLALKYNFSLTGLQPYVGLEGGAFVLGNGTSTTEVGIAPRLGLRIPVSRGLDVDLNLKLDVISGEGDNFTYVGANGGFAYILDRADVKYR